MEREVRERPPDVIVKSGVVIMDVRVNANERVLNATVPGA